MKLTKTQNRFIKNKSMGFSLMKGKSLTGKTIASIHRIINLENNYCLYEDDRILYLTSNLYKLEESKNIYGENSNGNEFYSLFSVDKNRVEFNLINYFIEIYSKGYKEKNNLKLKNINDNTVNEILSDDKFIESLSAFRKKSKLLTKLSIKEIYDEITWIKACDFSRDEYSEVHRKGRKHRLIRNSYSRDAIYSLMELYTSLMWGKGYMDIYDEIIFATKYSKTMNNKYTHIVLDGVESLTRSEIKFIKSLYENKAYSSFVFVLNSENQVDKNNWLIKGRKLNTLGADFKGKSFSFKKEFKKEEVIKNEYIEKFKYINFKHKNIMNFNLDSSSSKKEIFLEDNIVFNEDELVEVNVFNDIAAGNPIEINDEVKEKFYLPKGWLERGKDTFILHVKGDSMIDKDINDGDLVVIKKQNTAYNNDIVAASIDGEATLKTLKLNGESPMLMAANPMYGPISLEGKEVGILGVAIGVIKK